MTSLNEKGAQHGHAGGAHISELQSIKSDYTSDDLGDKVLFIDNTEVALAYAHAGFRVFPADDGLKPSKNGVDYVTPEKRPLFHISPANDATSDPDQIREWWAKRPSALIGLPCGVNGIVVVDTDDHGGPDGIGAFNRLVEANHGLPDGVVSVDTQSGGKHYIFRQPSGSLLGCSKGSLPGGIEVRGEGGYIIAPGTRWKDPTGAVRSWKEADYTPSLLDGRDGVPAPPQWLLESIKGLSSSKLDQTRSGTEHNNAPSSERAYFLSALQHIPADDRDDWFKIGGAIHSSNGLLTYDDWAEWSKKSSKFDPADQQATWAGYGNGQKLAKVGSIIELARRHGFSGRKYPDQSYDGLDGSEWGSETVFSGFWFHGDMPASPVSKIIDGLLAASGVTFLGGQSGSGKSMVAVDMSVALASGQKFANRETKGPLGVIYIAAEGGSTLPSRLAAAVDARGLADERLPIAIINDVGDLTSSPALSLICSKIEKISQIIHARFGCRTGLVIVDTLAEAFSMKDENSAGDTGRVAKLAAQLGDTIKAATLLIHHYGKDPSTGLRGSSYLRGKAEGILAVLADRNELTGACTNRQLVQTKDRSGPEGASWPFDIQHIHLGVDEDGRPFGAGSINFGDEIVAGSPKKSGASKQSPVVIHLMNSLRSALQDHGVEKQVDRDGVVMRVVRKAQVRDVFISTWVSDVADPAKQAANRRQAYKRGLAGALESNLVEDREFLGEELLWIANS
jgi:hypothetical protein